MLNHNFFLIYQFKCVLGAQKNRLKHPQHMFSLKEIKKKQFSITHTYLEAFIFSVDHTRVLLQPIPGKPRSSDYINANYIDVSTCTLGAST